jgi:hypothetical protein
MHKCGGQAPSIVQVAASLASLISERNEAMEIKRPATFGAGSLSYGRPGFAVTIEVAVFQLFKLKQRVAEESLNNIEIIKASLDDPELPAAAVDGVPIVNAYHEMTAHEVILKYVMSALKPGGILVLMEGIWNEHESRSRDEQVNFHELAPAGPSGEQQFFAPPTIKYCLQDTQPPQIGGNSLWCEPTFRPG